jgi:NTP pyrophosphatase (non-canonical NTP hydrolase)
MSELMEKYRQLAFDVGLTRIKHDGHDSVEEDDLLDRMDELWYAMSEDEHLKLDGWNSCCGSLNYLAGRIAKWSVSKGWETNWHNVPGKLMLVVTELAEAMEWYRNFSQEDIQFLDDGKVDFSTDRPTDSFHGFRVEIADAVIRLLNLSASLGINIEAEIEAKMEKNEKRPYKHGGKNC